VAHPDKLPKANIQLCYMYTPPQERTKQQTNLIQEIILAGKHFAELLYLNARANAS